MKYRRMSIEVEAPEELGYGTIQCNLSESSIWDAHFGDWSGELDNLVLCYGAHRGKDELREAIAASYRASQEDILVVPGASAALFIVNTSLLETGTSMVVARPNYATNIETPRLLPCSVKFIELKFEDRFELDMAALAAQITPETRLVSVTYPHNPTGTVLSESKLRELIDLVERRNCYLLLDETYRDLHRGDCPPLAATLSSSAISVSSLSKAFGLPGIRMGWIVCKNPELRKLFLAGKEQIFICNSVIDEEIALRVMLKRDALLSDIRGRVAAHFRIVREWMQNEKHLEWVEPQGGVVCLPRMRADVPIDTGAFYDRLLKHNSTYVGPGHWFEISDRYFRLGYAWEPHDKLRLGLQNISRALADSVR
jgi:aspartate/methionine/tyrosine aminotransferase